MTQNDKLFSAPAYLLEQCTARMVVLVGQLGVMPKREVFNNHSVLWKWLCGCVLVPQSNSRFRPLVLLKNCLTLDYLSQRFTSEVLCHTVLPSSGLRPVTNYWPRL